MLGGEGRGGNGRAIRTLYASSSPIELTAELENEPGIFLSLDLSLSRSRDRRGVELVDGGGEGRRKLDMALANAELRLSTLAFASTLVRGDRRDATPALSRLEGADDLRAANVENVAGLLAISRGACDDDDAG